MNEQERRTTLADLTSRFIEVLGEDPQRPGLRRTPVRVSEAMTFLTSGYDQDVDMILGKAVFEEDYSEMILVKERPRCGYTDVYLYANTGPGPGQWALIYRVETGLPVRTMRCEVHPGDDERGVLRLGFLPSRLNKRRVPTQPIWPGFAVNTIFYSTLLWLLIPGPFVLRRFLRLRRGLCPKCAYPMGESSVCTECGCGLPKRARTT